MNYTTMKEVTKDEFFGIINEGKLDVLVRPETKEPGHWYPHTTEFKFRDGTVFGKVVEDFHDGEHYPVVEKYYISAPCFVRTTDIEERTKLVSWLESIGYTYCVGCLNARSAISSPLIPYIMVSTRAETDFVECLLYRPDNGIDCGCNVGLFKTLAAIGHSDTLEQQERSMRVRVKNSSIRYRQK